MKNLDDMNDLDFVLLGYALRFINRLFKRFGPMGAVFVLILIGVGLLLMINLFFG